MTKLTTTETTFLDMRELAHRIFPDEQFRLPRGLGKVQAFKHSLLVLLAIGAHAEVRYTSTTCNFGGQRLWFVCEECGKQVLVVYLSARVRYGHRVGEFVCRRCANICYPSQLEDPSSRAYRSAAKVREKLGGSSNLREPFPQKPKGMHWTTYRQWHRREMAAKAQILESMSSDLDRLKRQAGRRPPA